MNAAPAQDCVDLSAIEAGVARFGRGRRAHSVAVLDIFAADGSLANADVSTQEEILAGRAQFLNAQTAPFQVLVRAEPVDLEGHIRRLQGRVPKLPQAEDAEYLAPELGGGLDAQDVLELGHYQCYARITDARTGERLPAFSVQLEPPPVGDSNQAAALARASAEKYGRDALDVELDLQSALDRIKGPSGSQDANDVSTQRSPADVGVPWGTGVVAAATLPHTGELAFAAKHERRDAPHAGQEPLEPWRELV